MKIKLTYFFIFVLFNLLFLGCENPSSPSSEGISSVPTTSTSPENSGASTSPANPETPVVTYTVKFVTEHGVLPNSIKNGIVINENTSLKAQDLPTLSEEGYAFGGWWYGETQVIPDVYKVTKNVTLTAKWSEATVSYTVSFVSAHGTAPQTVTLPKNTVLMEDNAPNLSEDGYRFDGWYDGETKIEVGSYKIVKDAELSAKWTAGYIIHFDANGGTGEMEDLLIVPDGNNIKLTKNTFTQEGYIFNYWLNDEWGAPSDEDNLDWLQPTSLVAPKQIILYATWVKVSLVSFESDYGTVPDSFYIRADTPIYRVRESFPSLSDENHLFLGWYDGDEKIETDTEKFIKKDSVLKAKWKPKSKNLHYYINNTPVKTEYFVYGDTSSKPVYDYSSKNSNFLGWKRNKDSNIIDFPTGSEISFADIPSYDSPLILYAHFINIDDLFIDISNASELINKIQRKKYSTNASVFTVYITGKYTDADMKSISDALKDETNKINNIILDLSELQGMTMVNDHEFEKAKYTKKIILPDGVKTIGEYAFSNAIDDKHQPVEVEVPDSVNFVKPYAFKRAGVNKIPASLTCIGPYAFCGCSSLPQKKDAARSLEIPNTVRRIEAHAFRSCLNLVRVIIPSSVRYISVEAFSTEYSNPSTKNIALPGMGTSDWTREYCNWYTIDSDFADEDIQYTYHHGKQLYQQHNNHMNEQEVASYLNGTNKIKNEIAWYRRPE